MRIDAEPEIVERADEERMAERSADSALVFVPFRLRGNHLEGPFGRPVEDLLSRLPFVALVLAADDIDLDAEPEEGEAGEMASALDALKDAEKKAREKEKEAEKASEAAEKKLREMASAVVAGAGEELTSKIEAAEEAKNKADEAKRRAAKATAKAEEAARKAEALGVETEKADDLE